MVLLTERVIQSSLPKSPNSSFSRFPVFMTSLIMSHCQALTNSVSSLYAIQWQQKGLGFETYIMVAYLWSSDHVPMSSRLSCSMCMCTHQKVLKDDPIFLLLQPPMSHTQVPIRFLTALYSPSSFSVQNDSIRWAPYHGAL